MGRLRVLDQLDSHPRFRSDDLWPLLAPHLCRLLNGLRSGNHSVHANLFRRIYAGSNFRAHVGKRMFNNDVTHIHLWNKLIWHEINYVIRP